jgi:hypothetical protein
MRRVAGAACRRFLPAAILSMLAMTPARSAPAAPVREGAPMADAPQPPDAPPPCRVLFLGAATAGWYAATDDERRAVILPRLVAVCRGWAALGAELISSFDDDLFMVGPPHSAAFSWYLLYRVPGPDAAVAMIDSFRDGRGGPRLDRWFRLEARIGRAFFPVEPNDGPPHQP